MKTVGFEVETETVEIATGALLLLLVCVGAVVYFKARARGRRNNGENGDEP